MDKKELLYLISQMLKTDTKNAIELANENIKVFTNKKHLQINIIKIA